MMLSGGELVRNPVVEVDDSGHILSVRHGVESIDREPHTEFYSGIMMAGMVNAHCHLELSYLLGAITPHGGFNSFASQIGAVRGRFTQQQILSAARRGEAAMQREGVAAVGDISNCDVTFDLKRESAIHYHTFAEAFGLWRESCDDMEDMLSAPHTSLTPHATYSLNDSVFRSIVERESNAPLSIHFMESEMEAELFEGRGALYEWYLSKGYKCDFLHYGSPAERLTALIPPTRSLLLVHNCSIRQRDIDTIMSHFTAPIYWVVSPRSNEYISHLRPPLELLMSNGLNICVGTDSLASNHSLSMVEELRAMPSAPLASRLDWATRGGAAALGLDDLGDIEVGKRTAINILSGVDYTTMQLTEKSRITRII